MEKQESVQQQQQSRRKLSDQEIYNDSEVMMIKMNNNNNNKIDNNYNLIGENFSSTKKQTTTMEWNIEKFCDPKTREKEFQWLFDQVYITLLWYFFHRKINLFFFFSKKKIYFVLEMFGLIPHTHTQSKKG